MTASPLLKTAMVAVQQIALGAVLALLIITWLHVPDANAFEVFASAVVALLIAAVACAGESAIALRLVNRQLTVRALSIGAGAVFVAALLWFGISVGVDHVALKEGLWVGYLNSRFPASLRNVFSYEHLSVLFTWLCNAIRWIAAALLAAAAFACAATENPVRALLAILRFGKYWLAVLLLVIVGAVINGALLAWTPGHGLFVETLSLVLRILIVIVLNAASIAFLLQCMAQAVLRVQSAGTVAPDVSQPRTIDIP